MKDYFVKVYELTGLRLEDMTREQIARIKYLHKKGIDVCDAAYEVFPDYYVGQAEGKEE